MSQVPPVVLFGYESSTFTRKIRCILRLKQIPYTFAIVPSMMPRPVFRNNFNLTYRKIPVLAIGRDLYCDTSIIAEALEHFFSEGYPSIYPPASDGRTNRAFMRGFSSYWTDRPLFRVTTGLIPSSVWRSSFGKDRAGLIGHKLDPDKLEAKVPFNLANYDLHCSMFESQLQQIETTSGSPWLYSTETPSYADASLYYAFQWGNDIAKGLILNDLSGGELSDTNTAGADTVFNKQRHPALLRWYNRVEEYLKKQPNLETKVENAEDVIDMLKKYGDAASTPLLLPTPNASHADLDTETGLVKGTLVKIAPDDTGRDDPTVGTLVAISPEEVVIKPQELERPPTVDVNIHFPRLGFVVRPMKQAKI